MIHAMNHFTILTQDLDATLDFYVGGLGLEPGPLFCHDPNGAKVELDFDAAESPDTIDRTG